MLLTFDLSVARHVSSAQNTLTVSSTEQYSPANKKVPLGMTSYDEAPLLDYGAFNSILFIIIPSFCLNRWVSSKPSQNS